MCKHRITKPKWLALRYTNREWETQDLRSFQGQRRKITVLDLRRRTYFWNIPPGKIFVPVGTHLPQRIRIKLEGPCVFTVQECNGIFPGVGTQEPQETLWMLHPRPLSPPALAGSRWGRFLYWRVAVHIEYLHLCSLPVLGLPWPPTHPRTLKQ